jgi:hypothetical protein
LTTGHSRKLRDTFGRNRKYDFDHDNKIAYGSVSLRLDEIYSENFVKNMALPGSFPFISNRWRRKTSDLSYQCYDVCGRSICCNLFDCIDDEEREKVLKPLKIQEKKLLKFLKTNAAICRKYASGSK